MTDPPTIWHTLTRELQRWGHKSWLRRALEWCGVVRRETYRDGDRWRDTTSDTAHEFKGCQWRETKREGER